MLALTTMFSACHDADDDINYLKAHFTSDDAAIAPLVISVKVLSTEGQSVLNNALTPYISATYQGQTYYCDKPARSFTPNFYGLKHMNDFLIFGELDGSQTYKNEQIIFSWGGDIKPDTITFTHIPLIENSFYLNGDKQEGYNVIIHKDLNVNIRPDNIEDENISSEIKSVPMTISDKACFIRNSQFAFNILFQLSDCAQKSFIYSPLALYNALGILANGIPSTMEGQGLRYPFLEMMGADIETISVLNSLYKTVNTYLSLVDPTVYASTANGLFIHNGFTLYNGFANLIAEYYQSDYALLDFNDRQTAVKEINQWSYQKSHGSIPVIIDHVTPSDSAFILSTASFKADWRSGFDPGRTEMADFMIKDNTTQPVRMMHGLFLTRHFASDSFEYIELPLANHAWDLSIVLPKEGGYKQEMASWFANILANPEKAELKVVDVYLPRFTIELQHNSLMKWLHLFLPYIAHYTEMSPNMNFHPTRISQHIYFLVNETGCATFTEHDDDTRSVTTKQSSFATRSDEPQSEAVTFRANQPFFYFIRERSSGAILIAGFYNGRPWLYVD